MTERQFGPYVLEELIGAGSMGEVYRARNTEHDRWVALKLLPEALADDLDYQARFRHESLVAARLRDPHVIPIHDFGEIDGRLFIDMRLVDGEDLGSLLASSGALPARRAVDLIDQIAEALDSAHAEGLVHRDIKPSNVLVGARDFVYVIDFGIARARGPAYTSLTAVGATIGTLEYMAPERFRGGDVDGRADVYSLSCVLAECLTGQRPFSGDDLPSLMYAHLTQEPASPSSLVPTVPRGLDDVVRRGMAKEPEDRFPTAGEFAAAARAVLGQATAGPPTLITGASTAGRAPAQTPASQPPGPRGGGGETFVPPRAATGGLLVGPPSTPGGNDPPSGEPPLNPIDDPSASGPPAAPPQRRGRRRPRRSIVVVAVALLVGVAAAAVLVVHPWSRTRSPTPAAVAQTVQKAAPAAVATAVPIPSIVPTPIPAGADPTFVVASRDGRQLYVANGATATITVIDTSTNEIVASIPVSAGPPQFLAFSPDGSRIYVSVWNAAKTIHALAVVDANTNKVISTVPMASRPFLPAVTADGKHVYVPNHDTGDIVVVDTETLKVVADIKVPANPHWLSFTPDGKRAYVADHESNLLSVIDTGTHKVLTTIPVGRSPHSVAVNQTRPLAINVNYDDSSATLTDTNTNKVVATIPVGPNPQEVAWSADGRFAYVVDVANGSVSVIDASATDPKQDAVTATLPVGHSPSSIAVLPDGKSAYVANMADGTLTELTIGR
ncbi:MAG: hypothetical protein JWO98_4835 [Frankiales bacterium]|nr:hypothetical protein [Frankiales bacterium]